MKEIIAIIPARGGSKGIKNKNIYKINDKELILYTIEFAKSLHKYLDFIISTDSKKIQKVLKNNNIHVNSLRPKYLSKDTSLTKDVIYYELKKNNIHQQKYKYVLLLQPTCPFRKKSDFFHALKILKLKQPESLVSISSVGANHPFRMKEIKNGKLQNYIKSKNENMLPRQKLPDIYIRSGSYYFTEIDFFFKNKSLVSKKSSFIVLKDKYSINIDSTEDIILAEYYAKN